MGILLTICDGVEAETWTPDVPARWRDELMRVVARRGHLVAADAGARDAVLCAHVGTTVGACQRGGTFSELGWSVRFIC